MLGHGCIINAAKMAANCHMRNAADGMKKGDEIAKLACNSATNRHYDLLNYPIYP
jgi:hypothetical protein